MSWMKYPGGNHLKFRLLDMYMYLTETDQSEKSKKASPHREGVYIVVQGGATHMRSRGKMSNRASTHKTLPKSRRHETTCCSQPQQMIISEWTPLLLSSCVKFMLSHLPALPPPHRIEHAPSVRIISFSIRAIDPTPDPSPKPCVVCACGSKSASFHWPTPQFFSLSLSLSRCCHLRPRLFLSLVRPLGLWSIQ